MTTPQLPPLPEQVLPCPFCGGRAWIISNRDTHKLFAEHSESCLWADDEDPIVTTPATDYALAALIESWNTRAAISARPVAESIHEANARTLQALVDELREMLGVKDGESLKEAVRALSASATQSDTSGMWCINIPGPNEVHAAPNETIAHYMASRHNAAMAAFYAKRPAEDDCSPSVKSTLATAIKWPHDAESHAQEMSEFDWKAWGLVAPIKKEQEA